MIHWSSKCLQEKHDLLNQYEEFRKTQLQKYIKQGAEKNKEIEGLQSSLKAIRSDHEKLKREYGFIYERDKSQEERLSQIHKESKQDTERLTKTVHGLTVENDLLRTQCAKWEKDYNHINSSRHDLMTQLDNLDKEHKLLKAAYLELEASIKKDFYYQAEKQGFNFWESDGDKIMASSMKVKQYPAKKKKVADEPERRRSAKTS